MTEHPPSLDLDPFADDFPTDPYSHHALLRDAGPVFRLSRYGVGGMARHAEVSDALLDWQTFCSSRGGGLADFAEEKPWRFEEVIRYAGPVQTFSGPQHERWRLPAVASASG